MAKEKDFTKLSETAERVLAFIKENNGVVYSDIKKAIPEANPSHLTALVARELLTAEKVNVETVRVVKSKVNKYTIK